MRQQLVEPIPHERIDLVGGMQKELFSVDARVVDLVAR
jgi:hypothetical protein